MSDEEKITDLQTRVLALENYNKLQDQKLRDANDLIQQLKGAGTFMRFCLLFVGPIIGLLTWLKNHVNWN